MQPSKFDPKKHHRKSIRLQGYDYSQGGAYFVTIITYQRDYLFGEIVNEEMKLNRYGEIVQKWWDEIPTHFSNVEIGAFIIMPNHVHGIMVITDNRRGAVTVPYNQQGEKTPPLLHIKSSYFKARTNPMIKICSSSFVT
jgi:putative transposase